MNIIRMTENGFVAKGTNSGWPQFASLEFYMGHPPCQSLVKRPLLSPSIRQLLDDLGTGLAIGGLFALGQLIIVFGP